MRILYTVLYLHLLPFVILRLFWRSLKAPGYRKRIGERFAGIPTRKSDQPLLWVHAVSVGESIAATPMVKRWMEQHPQWQVCITTTTPTGSDRVKAAFGDSVLHYYLPYDVPSMMMRFLQRLNPSALVIMETELWPNLLAVCEQKKLPTLLINGRMSERSCRGYQKLSALTQPMFKQLTAIAAQSEQDAERFIALGAPSATVDVTGSIKFDVHISDAVHARCDALQRQLQINGRRVLVFASTHPGEDEQLVPVIQRIHQRDPSFLAIIVPRHPERFSTVYSLCEKHRLNVVKLTEERIISRDTSVVLGDTMGDMLAIYGLADACLVGGSLINHGGHNFLEPAAWGIPIFTGPHVFNFQAIADQLSQAKGLVMVDDHYAVERLLIEWLEAPEHYLSVGSAAKTVLENNRGALDKAISLIEETVQASLQAGEPVD